MRLALFDFDGTLTQKDTFLPFIYYATSRARVTILGGALTPWVLAYRAGLYPATKMRAQASFCAFVGRRQAVIDELGARYAQTLHAQLRTDALSQLRQHQAAGDKVVIVSASLAPYLRPFAATLGVDLACTELEAFAGVLSGRYVEGDCSGEEKARRVRARYRLEDYSTVFAYGDTPEDAALLDLAEHRFYRGR